MDIEIGTAAGDVYHYLAGNGPASVTALKKGTAHKDATVAMALGWLAREGKVVRVTQGRSTKWVIADA